MARPDDSDDSERVAAGESQTGHTVKGSEPVPGGFAPADERRTAAVGESAEPVAGAKEEPAPEQRVEGSEEVPGGFAQAVERKTGAGG